MFRFYIWWLTVDDTLEVYGKRGIGYFEKLVIYVRIHLKYFPWFDVAAWVKKFVTFDILYKTPCILFHHWVRYYSYLFSLLFLLNTILYLALVVCERKIFYIFCSNISTMNCLLLRHLDLSWPGIFVKYFESIVYRVKKFLPLNNLLQF